MFTGGDHHYFRWFANSILTLLVSARVGYGFAFYRFKGNTALFICVLIMMMIPFEILMLPLYREIIALRLTDSYWGIILPYLANPIAIFFLRQYLKGIPREIVGRWPLLVLKDFAKFRLPIGLSSLTSPYGNNYQLWIAGSILSIVPIIVIFVSAQKFFSPA